MWHNNRVEVFKSAAKHGVRAEDSLYVVKNSLRCLYLSNTPEKRLYLGFSPSGVALEVITLNTSNYGEAIIHAMPMRQIYRRLLEGGRNEWHRTKRNR